MTEKDAVKCTDFAQAAWWSVPVRAELPAQFFDAVAARIREEPNPTIIKIVDGWAGNFSAKRAEGLGFKADSSFDEIIKAHIADELGGKIG